MFAQDTKEAEGRMVGCRKFDPLRPRKPVLAALVIPILLAARLGFAQCSDLGGTCAATGDCCDLSATCFDGMCCFLPATPGCADASECCGSNVSCEASKCCFKNGVVGPCINSVDCCSPSAVCQPDGLCCSPPTGGCTDHFECCDGTNCESGTCCIPAYGTPTPNIPTCFGDSECCAGTCNSVAPFGAICCFETSASGCAVAAACCDFANGATCEGGTCCFPASSSVGGTGCQDDADCCLGTCEAVPLGNACCVLSGETGCTTDGQCCDYPGGATCQGGTCCLPASSFPPVGGTGCQDDADCCLGTCEAVPFGNACCVLSGETGCTTDGQCCDFPSGATCQGGTCCLPASSFPPVGGTGCQDDADCCLGTCEAVPFGNACCVVSGETGCTTDAQCCDYPGGATCQLGTCCLPASGSVSPGTPVCQDDADCCIGTCNPLIAGNHCCVAAGDSGCAFSFTCCGYNDGVLCESGTCCFPPFGHAPQYRCEDSGDCCRGSCHQFGPTGPLACCVEVGDSGCLADNECCEFSPVGTVRCETGSCCLPAAGVPLPGGPECEEDGDCCDGTCNTFPSGQEFCCIESGEIGCTTPAQCCEVADGATCQAGMCGRFGACTTCCECTHNRDVECAAIGGEFHLNMACADVNFVPDTTPPEIKCPEPVTLDRGDRFCNEGVPRWLGGASATDNCGEPTITTNAPECGFPFGSTTTITFTATDECGRTDTCTADITIGPAPRTESSKKGSLLMYPKVELRWAAGAGGVLLQDTFLELTNDDSQRVCVQLYFVNGDAPLDPVFDPITGGMIVEGEPGWEWVDCQFCLTPDQTTYLSMATGAGAGCQPFTTLDPDGGMGPGRPDPTTTGERHLRGFVYGWAVDQNGHEITWNHLSGAATLVNYRNLDAWDYNAYAFQTNCREPLEEPLDCTKFDEHGACCEAEVIPGQLGLDGFQYDLSYDVLLMDFLASGSTALTRPGNAVQSDTDLTLHPITADLRQDSIGPVTTKAEFAIWNENERRFSGTARCITCWDQTLLSLYGNPNHFLRSNLQTDKGKARIDGVESIVCDVNCVRDVYRHGALDIDFILDILGIDHVCSYDASLLGVVAKTLAFSGAATARATAGRNLVGMGTQEGWIKWDIVSPPGTSRAVDVKPRSRGGR